MVLKNPLIALSSPIIGDWGEIIDAVDPQSGNRFRFRFVFVSCVRASGRGEAVWACERAVCSNAGAQNGKMCCGGGSGSAVVFSFLLLCPWVFWLFETFTCYVHGFFDRWPPYAAICMGFLIVCAPLVTVSCYMHGFFDRFSPSAAICIGFLIVFAPLATVSCYMHRFFDRFAPSAAICMGFLIAFAPLATVSCYMHGFFDRFTPCPALCIDFCFFLHRLQPLAAICMGFLIVWHNLLLYA